MNEAERTAAAKYLGKRGGDARAKALTSEQRRQSASHAARARWATRQHAQNIHGTDASASDA